MALKGKKQTNHRVSREAETLNVIRQLHRGISVANDSPPGDFVEVL